MLHEVLGVLLQALVVVVGALGFHALTLAERLDGGKHILLVGTSVLEDASGGGVALHDGEEDRLHAHELVAHLLGNVLSVQEDLVGVSGEVWLTSSLHSRQVLHLLLQEQGDLVGVHTQLLEDIVGYIRCFLDDTAEKMHRFDGLLTISLRNVHGFLYRLLRLDCKFVECHILNSFLVFVSCFL